MQYLRMEFMDFILIIKTEVCISDGSSTRPSKVSSLAISKTTRFSAKS